MKFFMPEVPEKFRPDFSLLRYPKYSIDWGIEQDFERFLLSKPRLLTDSPEEADFVFLPVYWTRYHINNGFGSRGLPALSEFVNGFSQFGRRLLLICQYDDGPLVDVGNSTLYLGSRKSERGRDAPLLASTFSGPRFAGRRMRRATFAGNLKTHSIREQLNEYSRGLSDSILYVEERNLNARDYFRLLRTSAIAIAPRGYGGSSFRFFEAISAGAVPWLIGERDVRPFQTQIPPDTYSYFSPTIEHFMEAFERFDWLSYPAKRRVVSHVARKKFRFQAWADLLLSELEDMQRGAHQTGDFEKDPRGL